MNPPKPKKNSLFNTSPFDPSKNVIIQFWSGGKDSLSSLYETSQSIQDDECIILLTTIDPITDLVPIQEIPVPTIVKQARDLNLPLLLVPINKDYAPSIQKALTEYNVSQIVFGDIHLSEIKNYRQQIFDPSILRFPLWQRDQEKDLIPSLMLVCEKYNIRITISSIDGMNEKCKKEWVGQVYDEDFIRKLPEDVDKMGENGEFHTSVEFI